MSRLSTEMEAVSTASVVRPIFLIECDFDTGPLYLWSGIGTLTYGGIDYVGAGNLLSVGGITETTDLSAQGTTVVLSGIGSPLLELARDEDYQGRELIVKFGAMDGSGNVISSPVEMFSGFMDVMTIDESGETATIAVTVENRLIGFDKTRIRRYTAEDQKIDYPNDKGFEFVSKIQEMQITWGRPGSNSAVGPVYRGITPGGERIGGYNKF